eukprot:764804-Hanusia_phi.AAC.2
MSWVERMCEVTIGSRAFAHIKLENYGQAVSDAEASLKLNPTFVKVNGSGRERIKRKKRMYHEMGKGTAYLALGKTRQALADFRYNSRGTTGCRFADALSSSEGSDVACRTVARLRPSDPTAQGKVRPSERRGKWEEIGGMGGGRRRTVERR